MSVTGDWYRPAGCPEGCLRRDLLSALGGSGQWRGWCSPCSACPPHCVPRPLPHGPQRLQPCPLSTHNGPPTPHPRRSPHPGSQRAARGSHMRCHLMRNIRNPVHAMRPHATCPSQVAMFKKENSQRQAAKRSRAVLLVAHVGLFSFLIINALQLACTLSFTFSMLFTASHWFLSHNKLVYVIVASVSNKPRILPTRI